MKIDVAFRQPVGLLDLGNGRYQRLDRQAVQIGQPLVVTEESADWLRINVHQPRVEGGEWSRVEDERIERAAEICRDLQSSWKELGLYRVVFYWPAGTPVSATAIPKVARPPDSRRSMPCGTGLPSTVRWKNWRAGE
ncbi:MAG: hypothetical protein LW697_12745 [Blastopirellula sp.]|nr:hypothetical protein [Blastopirellula sp.]